MLRAASPHSLRVAHLATSILWLFSTAPATEQSLFKTLFFGVPTRAPNEPWVSRRRGHDLSGGGGERGRRVGRSYMPAPVRRALPAMGPTSFPLDEPVRPTGCHLAPSSAPGVCKVGEPCDRPILWMSCRRSRASNMQHRLRARRRAHPLDVEPSPSIAVLAPSSAARQLYDPHARRSAHPRDVAPSRPSVHGASLHRQQVSPPGEYTFCLAPLFAYRPAI